MLQQLLQRNCLYLGYGAKRLLLDVRTREDAHGVSCAIVSVCMFGKRPLFPSMSVRYVFEVMVAAVPAPIWQCRGQPGPVGIFAGHVAERAQSAQGSVKVDVRLGI